MARTFNRKCFACANLPIDKSREKSCWVEGKCNNTRKYYRSREKKLLSKKQNYARSQGKVIPQKFALIPDSYRAELVLYGKPPNKLGLVNGGVKAVKVNIYQGSLLKYESEITRTSGMIQRELEDFIDSTLQQLNEQFAISKFGEIIWKDMDISCGKN